MDEAGRLLEGLEQRVLTLVAHRVCRLEDEDAAAALEGPVGRGPDYALPHRLDHVLGPGRSQPDEVGMRRGVEQGAAAGVLGVLGAAGEELGGEGAGGVALAGATGPAEEVGVRGPGLERRAQRPADPRLVLGGLGEGAHERLRTTSRTRAWTSSSEPPASIATTRSGAVRTISS